MAVGVRRRASFFARNALPDELSFAEMAAFLSADAGVGDGAGGVEDDDDDDGGEEEGVDVVVDVDAASGASAFGAAAAAFTSASTPLPLSLPWLRGAAGDEGERVAQAAASSLPLLLLLRAAAASCSRWARCWRSTAALLLSACGTSDGDDCDDDCDATPSSPRPRGVCLSRLPGQATGFGGSDGALTTAGSAAGGRRCRLVVLNSDDGDGDGDGDDVDVDVVVGWVRLTRMAHRVKFRERARARGTDDDVDILVIIIDEEAAVAAMASKGLMVRQCLACVLMRLRSRWVTNAHCTQCRTRCAGIKPSRGAGVCVRGGGPTVVALSAGGRAGAAALTEAAAHVGSTCSRPSTFAREGDG